jgi:hypothetical protein
MIFKKTHLVFFLGNNWWWSPSPFFKKKRCSFVGKKKTWCHIKMGLLLFLLQKRRGGKNAKVCDVWHQ